MATLQLAIPTHPTYSSQLFVRAGPGSDSTKNEPPLQFRSSGLIHDGNSRVFRGKFKEMVAGTRARKVVCKLVVGSNNAVDRLKFEAELYENNLKSIQGGYVPKFYGFFSGTISGEVAACMLLQDCGVMPAKHPVDLDIDFRAMVIQALVYIHKCGVQHGDFSSGNMVVDDAENPTRVVIIDFDHAELHHCERKLDINIYQFAPPWTEFGCSELYAIALELEIWTPRSIAYNGGRVLLDFVDSPEALVANGPKFAECELRDFDPIGMASDAIQKYVEAYGGREEYLSGALLKTIIPMVKEEASESDPSEAVQAA